ncbi:MAG: hypothetical protein B7X43_00120 [Thiomonas sp. 15-63-373]|nr:MAG: hypothetical protein B7X43_00120 [Thiomonas sp. 15-63-373]
MRKRSAPKLEGPALPPDQSACGLGLDVQHFGGHTMIGKKPKEPSDKALESAYMREALSWETSREQSLLKSRRTAWIVAGAALVIAGIEALAVAGLAPLKSVQPYVIRVDSSTGLVDVPQPLTRAATPTEAMNRYFVQSYVTARESYDRDIASPRYEQVGLMSDSAVARDYMNSFSPANSTSPLNVYGQKGYVHIKIISVNFIKPNVAYVQFQRLSEKAGEQTPTTQQETATVEFKYENRKLTHAQRLINPLDFVVTHYSTSVMGAPVQLDDYTNAKPATKATPLAIYPPPPVAASGARP